MRSVNLEACRRDSAESTGRGRWVPSRADSPARSADRWETRSSVAPRIGSEHQKNAAACSSNSCKLSE